MNLFLKSNHYHSAIFEYRDVARENFDLYYKRAISPDLGGGLSWKTANKSKNACVDGPGSIAAFLLGLAARDSSYIAKAKMLFLWERDALFDKIIAVRMSDQAARRRLSKARSARWQTNAVRSSVSIGKSPDLNESPKPHGWNA